MLFLAFLTLHFFFVICASDKQISVFEFGYSDPMKILPLESVDAPNGYSICFRVQFSSWYKEVVLATSLFSFSLLNYQSGLGICKNIDSAHDFYWKGHIPISYVFWNSVCATYNHTDRSFILSLNGKFVLNLNEEKFRNIYVLQDPLTLEFEIGDITSFSGQLTDLNVWSRPLSAFEIGLFSTGCNPQFVQNSKPDKIIWSMLNVTNQDKASRRIQKAELCQDSKVLSSEDKIILRSAKPFYNYTHAYQFCIALNGHMPYPQNKSHLETLLSNNKNAKDHCMDRVWIPITRSSKNGSVLVYDTRNFPETIIPFQPLKENILSTFSTSNEQCIIAQLSTKQYSTNDCSENLCFMCQFPEHRMILNLNGNSEYVGTIDTVYAIMPLDYESNSFLLRGITGKSYIKQEQGRFEIRSSKNCVKAFFITSRLTPMGIHDWNWKQNCDENIVYELTKTEKLKLSNVSYILKYSVLSN